MTLPINIPGGIISAQDTPAREAINELNTKVDGNSSSQSTTDAGIDSRLDALESAVASGGASLTASEVTKLRTIIAWAHTNGIVSSLVHTPIPVL